MSRSFFENFRNLKRVTIADDDIRNEISLKIDQEIGNIIFNNNMAYGSVRVQLRLRVQQYPLLLIGF